MVAVAIVDRLTPSAQLPLLVVLLVCVLTFEFGLSVWRLFTRITARVARGSVDLAGRHKRLGLCATGWAGYFFYVALFGPLTDPIWIVTLVMTGQMLGLFFILTLVATAESHVAAFEEHRKARLLEDQFRSAHITGVLPPPLRVGPLDELSGVYVPTRSDLMLMCAPFLATAATWLAFR